MRGYRGTIAERFARKYTVELDTGCWLWHGSTDRRGYGQLRLGKRNLKYATHISLWLAGRPVPEGMQALHKCDTPGCVNPDHLFAGTVKDNMRDCMEKGRHSSPPIFRGSQNKAAKLTEELARLAKGDLANGMSLSQFRRKYGVSTTVGSQIRAGKLWKHV